MLIDSIATSVVLKEAYERRIEEMKRKTRAELLTVEFEAMAKAEAPAEPESKVEPVETTFWSEE